MQEANQDQASTPDSAQQPTPESVVQPSEQADQTPAAQPEDEASFYATGQDEQTAPTDATVTDIKPTALGPDETVTWSASEFIAHEKTPGWYGLFVLAAAAISALTYFVTNHDVVSTGAVVLITIAFGIFAGRKPEVRQYTLSHDGLQIGAKLYQYHEYKSFSVAEDGALVSLVLMPLKRFMPSLTIYLPPEMEDKVVQVFSERLPLEQHKQDAIDRLLKRIRF